MKSEIDIKPTERVDILYPSQFKIIQSSEVFSYSMDAILLAHFARVPKSYKSNIVDLCAGNGAVTMLLSSKTNAPITGVEIQDKLVDMAKRSAILNNIQDKIKYLNINLADHQSHFKSGTIDMITCNPPYFKTDPSRQNPNLAVALARHEITLDMDKLLKSISQLLKMNGATYLVYSTERFVELLNSCSKYNLVPKRIQMVYSKPGRSSKFFLIELIKNGSELGFEMLEPMYIMNEDSTYSKEMSQILYG